MLNLVLYMDSLRSGPYGKILDLGITGTAEGHYTEGAILFWMLFVKRLRVVIAYKGLKFHFLRGGTGSGMKTLLISKISEEYPDRMMLHITMFMRISGNLEIRN
ncbi:tubulin beta-3 chain-like [Papaver somniferum]|uniref:tubulin beta-3 chain-like n=1 Tax=Papaver somniferum TaxID=3469 RepID=UPI000E70219B|nr:tubulin beta-3 chain-like [Papaver somniferum]